MLRRTVKGNVTRGLTVVAGACLALFFALAAVSPAGAEQDMEMGAPAALPPGTLVTVSGFTYWSTITPNGFPTKFAEVDLTTNDAYCISHSTSIPQVGDQYKVVEGSLVLTNATTRDKVARALSAVQDPVVVGRGWPESQWTFSLQYAIWHYTDPGWGCAMTGSATYGTLCRYIVNNVDAGVYAAQDVSWFQHNVASNRRQPLAGADACAEVALGDFVWIDSNGDGVWQSGEPGKNGVTVELYLDDGDGVLSAGDTLVRTTVTKDLPYVDPGNPTYLPGFYYFPALAEGDYFVKIPASQFSTGGALVGYTSSAATVSGNSDLNNRDHGYVYGLLGNDGYVASTKVTLTLGGEPDIASDADNANGNATLDFGFTAAGAQQLDFGDLPLTPYYQTLLADDGARHLIVPNVRLGATIDAETDGQPNATATGDDTAGASDDEDGVIFLHPLVPGRPAGIQVTASVAGCLNAWIDAGGAGDQVLVDEAINAGTTPLTINNNVGAAAGIVYARFRFTEVCGQGGEQPGGYASSGEVEDYALASLGDFVWLDANGNGQQEIGETPVGGVTVRLLDANGNTVLDAAGTAITAVTGADGKYEFVGLPPGTYSVSFALPTAYLFTTPNAGNDTGDSDADPLTGRTGSVTLGPASSNTTLDGGFVPAVAIGDTVFCDINGNSIQDPGDRGQSGVKVRLYGLGVDSTAYTVDDPLIGETTTDGNGHYLFAPIAPGKYYAAVLPGTVPPTCGTKTSSGGGGNPDAGDQTIPGGDDGVLGTGARSGEVVSGVLNATAGGQTTADTGDPAGYPDGSSYMTVDFGFTNDPTAVTMLNLSARPESFREYLSSLVQRIAAGR